MEPLCFITYWNIVGDTVHHLVLEAVVTGDFSEELAETLLVLIPKSPWIITQSMKAFIFKRGFQASWCLEGRS